MELFFMENVLPKMFMVENCDKLFLTALSYLVFLCAALIIFDSNNNLLAKMLIGKSVTSK